MTTKPFLQLKSGLMIYRHIKSIYTNYMMYIKYPRYQIYNLHGALHLFLVDKRKSSGMRSKSSYLIVAVQCRRVPYLCVCPIFLPAHHHFYHYHNVCYLIRFTGYSHSSGYPGFAHPVCLIFVYSIVSRYNGANKRWHI